MNTTPSIIPRTLSRNGWTMAHIVLVCIMLAVSITLTFNTWRVIWITAVYYNHALYVLAVPFISVWLFYVRRHRMRFCTPSHAWAGLLFIALGWGLVEYGKFKTVFTITALGSLLVVIGFVISVIGMNIPRRFLPAFVVLFMIIPIPTPIAYFISEPIQAATTDITQVIYSIFGSEIMREGNILINDDNLPILISETGRIMGLFMAFVLMSYAFAFGLPLKSSARVILMLISPFIALLASILRSLSTTWLYNVYDPLWVHSLMPYIAWITLFLSIAIYYIIIRLLFWTAIPMRRFSVPKEQ
ncbi:exosortase/archaeosortase family protein [Planctomycetota bacterium]|nr:exosortase/archaeosortase family protein [Planctomycetota bacterium]